jgi:hypothetical protein
MVAGYCGRVVAIGLGAIILAAFPVDSARSQDKSTKPAVTVPQQCVCTMEYDPVCGRTRGGNEASYSNPCQARCAGATVIKRGRC